MAGNPQEPSAPGGSGPAPGRNLVVCCDGTGNDVSGDLSNVFKFYRCLVKSPDQICYYDPGVGTFAQSQFWKFMEDASRVIGLATGYGLDANVLDAYRFLVETWREGDRIYLFGFSRGAYTVRALAGLINMVGLVEPHQLNLESYALGVYRTQKEEQEGDPAPAIRPRSGRDRSSQFYRAARFRVSVGDSPRRPQIHLMGLWDTVSSVFEIQRAGLLYWPRRQSLPYTHHNPFVLRVRQALAIDERRRFFRPVPWNPDGKMPAGHDHRAVWFAGVHSDIGGGYPEERSHLAKIPLHWMIEQVAPFGLAFKQAQIDRVVLGKDTSPGGEDYVGPDPAGPANDSMTLPWKPFEYWPKKARNSDNPALRQSAGYYLPRGEARTIPSDALIHASVLARQQAKIGYDPPNLPANPIYVSG